VRSANAGGSAMKIEVSDAQLAAVNITPDPFHPE
jgi:hypothetical protein